MAFVQIAFPLPVNQTFSYAVPQALEEQVRRGMRVLAPFRGKPEEGIVVGVGEEPSFDPSKIKELSDCLDELPFFSDELLELCRWVAEYYLCSWGEALNAAMSAGFRVMTRRRVWRVPPLPTLGEGTRAPLQDAILESLRVRDGQTIQQLQSSLDKTSLYSALARLEADGRIRVEEEIEAGATAKTALAARLTTTPAETSRLLDGLRKTAPKQAAILEILCRLPEGKPVAELVRDAEANHSTLRVLEKKGLVVLYEEERERDPLADVDGIVFSSTPLPLNASQRQAFQPILEALESSQQSVLRHPSTPPLLHPITSSPHHPITPFLLYGVTGSGKTEVYLQAVEKVLADGRGAIVLVPEISLTPQTVSRFVSRFGKRVAVLHSRLSEGERYDEWRRIRAGRADIVVGPRSAVFAPLERLGIIILDEEHETSYKQEDPAPRYHAREVARKRCEMANALLILGSATPSLEGLYRAQQGEYRLLRMPTRVNESLMPAVHICDMREELKAGNRSIFSTLLRERLAERLERGEQAMLLLNRRGHSTYVFCRDCGHVERCPKCFVSLTYHQRTQLLLCHHCGFVKSEPKLCPACGSRRIKYLGLGTQQVEEETKRLFPTARIGRMDADTTTRKGTHQKILDAFRDRESDILIGTQMIAKGLDFPNVTLVGVILAETSLHFPDFRSPERAFHLLTQVAGRAGRGTLPGEVVFQTYQPEHYSIQTAQHHDYDAFCELELAERRQCGYPPYTHALRVLLRSEDEREVIEAAQSLGAILGTEGEHFPDVTVRGPASAPFPRVRGQFRWHLLLRGENPARIRDLARHALDAASPMVTRGKVAVILDMDPVSLL